MIIMQEHCQGEPSLVALFTFVARNPLTQKSTQLNPLQPQTAEETQLFQERQQVADARRAARNVSAAEQQDGKQTVHLSLAAIAELWQANAHWVLLSTYHTCSYAVQKTMLCLNSLILTCYGFVHRGRSLRLAESCK